VRAARDAGFENLSLDLMYGLPGQSAADWRATLEQALALGPDHLSLYELTPEEGTPLSADLCAGRLSLPSEEEVLAMMAVIDALVAASPLARYEISNYAAVGRECRHNLTYWQNGCYLGLGPGATAFYGGVRRTAVADPDEYCRRLGQGRSVWQVEERLDREAAFRETVVMGLRLTAGVDEAALRRRFGLDPASYYGPLLEQLVAQGLLVRRDGRLRLTAAGLPLANRVMAELV
ncbi:MAG: coproporphyrinogen III oxidase family protein, partial [Desulfobulbus sp.]|nr:coproporphyrinogen III oxidase family protein [Desulfobulbus sp.]